MKKFKGLLGLVTSLLGIIAVVFGAWVYIDSRYVQASIFSQLEQRVTVNELRATLNKALENLYFYRAQLRKYPNDDEVKTKLKEAEEEVKDIKEQIKEEKKKKDNG